MAPTKKKWLISSPQAIAEDERAAGAFTKDWLRSNPFPGASSSIDAKCKFLKGVHNCFEEELEDSLYMTSAPEGRDVVAKILLEHAPDKLYLQIRINRARLEKATLDDEGDKASFASNLSEYALPGYDGEAKWDTYKSWLLQANNKSSSPDGIDSSHVVLAEIECSKNDKMDNTFTPFLEKMGILGHYLKAIPYDRKMLREACYEWGVQRIIGENMYYPASSGAEAENKMIVPLMLMLAPKSRSASSAGCNAEEASFEKELKDAKAATKNTSDAKTYLIIPKKNSESEKPVTAQHMHVLWLPAVFNEHSTRVSGHFNWGEGEARQIQKRLEKGNTDTGNLKAEIFEQELRYANSLKNVKEKLCATLALTKAASDDTYWMNDNECPEDVAKNMKNLATLWRTVLLTQTDEELGIDAPAGLAATHGGSGGSREGLYAFLAMMAPEFKNASEYCKVTFNWKPSASSKKQKTST